MVRQVALLGVALAPDRGELLERARINVVPAPTRR